jgi:hypothetical protein
MIVLEKKIDISETKNIKQLRYGFDSKMSFDLHYSGNNY